MIAVDQLGLQDELKAIYHKDCTIRIPFLNLNYISPTSLLHSNDQILESTVKQICSSELMVNMETIHSKTNLTNLVATLAYHKNTQENIPMTSQDVEQNARIVKEINSTLRSILKL